MASQARRNDYWETTDGGAKWHHGISLAGTLLNGPKGFDEFAFADAQHGFGFVPAATSCRRRRFVCPKLPAPWTSTSTRAVRGCGNDSLRRA